MEGRRVKVGRQRCWAGGRSALTLVPCPYHIELEASERLQQRIGGQDRLASYHGQQHTHQQHSSHPSYNGSQLRATLCSSHHFLRQAGKHLHSFHRPTLEETFKVLKVWGPSLGVKSRGQVWGPPDFLSMKQSGCCTSNLTVSQHGIPTHSAFPNDF